MSPHTVRIGSMFFCHCWEFGHDPCRLDQGAAVGLAGLWDCGCCLFRNSSTGVAMHHLSKTKTFLAVILGNRQPSIPLGCSFFISGQSVASTGRPKKRKVCGLPSSCLLLVLDVASQKDNITHSDKIVSSSELFFVARVVRVVCAAHAQEQQEQ